MKPKFVTHCPVCCSTECTKDLDFPETMENCSHCGAEWNLDGDLTLDSRIGLTEGEIIKRGWFVECNK